jgi:tRNA(Ile)-lysidine synthase
MQTCLKLIPEETQRVFLAFSGGLDSSALLHLLISESRLFAIVPWHINHGLVENAADMEQFCADRAKEYSLDIRVDRLDLSKVKGNLEAVARTQRYNLFEQSAGVGDCILTAHHADDQAETFLLNAFRGSGIAGLRGIARQRKLGNGLLLRPLLNCSRENLEAYARKHSLTWFEDPSNESLRFDRNYLRHQVIPEIKHRWPHFVKSLAGASDLQSEVQSLLEEIAWNDLKQHIEFDSSGTRTLDLPRLLEMSDARGKNLIRFWIAEQRLPSLTHSRMLELQKQLNSRMDALPEITMPEYSVRLYDQRLFLVKKGSDQNRDGEFEFGIQPLISIQAFDFCAKRDEILDRIETVDRGQHLSLKFRGDGDQPQIDGHRLKRLFQKHRVPPWERPSVPQIYLDNKLVGILK